jgi:hypothetical protein
MNLMLMKKFNRLSQDAMTRIGYKSERDVPAGKGRKCVTPPLTTS